MHCWGFNKQAYWLNHWSLIIDLNLSALPSFERFETTNLHSPHWVLSIQSRVLAIPLACGYRTVSRKSSPDLWKRVNFKSFRRPGPWNRERIKYGQENDSQKGQGKEPGDFSKIVSGLVPQPTTQGLCFLLSLQLLSSVAPHLSISFHNREIIIIW